MAAEPSPSGLMEAIAYFGTYKIQGCLLTLEINYCLYRSCDKSDRRASISFVDEKLLLTSAVLESLTGSFYSSLMWHRTDIVSGR